MGKIYLLLIALNGYWGFAQFEVLASHTYGGPGEDFLEAVAKTADGGFVMVGLSAEIGGDVTGNGGCSDMWLIKAGIDGEIQLQQSIAIDNCEYVSDIIVVPDGYVAVATVEGQVATQMSILKFDFSFNIQWQYTLEESTFWTSGSNLVATSNGGFLATAYVFDGTTIGTNVVTVDSAGTEVNVYFENNTNGTSVVLPLADGALVAYSAELPLGGHAPKFVKFDLSGQPVWSQTFEEELLGHDIGAIAKTTGGGYIAYSLLVDPLYYDEINLLKFNSNFSLEWVQTHEGSPQVDYPVMISQVAGGFLGVAFTYENNPIDIYVFHTDSNGVFVSDDYFGGPDADQPASALISQGDLIVVGGTHSSTVDFAGSNGLSDGFLMKIGSELSMGQQQVRPVLLWPNPVQSILHLDSETSIGTVTISDLLGKNVAEADVLQDQIDVSALSPGFYIMYFRPELHFQPCKFVKL